ncbi:MAG: rRNA maturation RNase YbeY [Schleiferiaceae bacterium]|nr:rRNA maturation RNase YbeY [Schleiferiaceae bacterium]
MEITQGIISEIKGAIQKLHPGYRLKKIDVYTCTDEELLAINIKHLQHDYYTDIITFDYSKGTKISGELFISIDRVKDNAAALGVAIEVELRRVIAHGLLHLLGFKDKSDEEVVEMRMKEDEVLAYLDKYGS